MQSSVDMEQAPISTETICDLIGEAISIPSMAKGQPTQFIVLNEVNSLSKASEIVPHKTLTVQALAAIIICGDLNKAELKDRWVLDCEAASQQIIVSAHAKGLAAQTSTIYPDSDRIYGMTTLLDLPDNIIAHTYVAMGSPATVSSGYEASCNERIHFNSWVRKKSVS